MITRFFKGASALLIVLSAYNLKAQEVDLMDLSFEELMNIEITSVSKKAERLQDVPSSIYVITSEDIQRSASQNLMNILRDHVPGFWAVANDYKNSDALIRNTYEGSVLVLLDGTPMLDNLFMNFDFENFEIPLEQIDRIEVIKGSGGTIYGANSATGVISIFTKNASDQQKVIASGQYAYPGQADVNLIATPLKNEKVSTTFYGKFSTFSGFKQMDVFENATSIVPSQADRNVPVTINNRYTEDDNKYTSHALGLNFEYKASENLKLSSAVNYNGYSNDKYHKVFFPERSTITMVPNADGSVDNQLYAPDSVYMKKINKTRVVGNVKADYSFSDDHNLFVRVSTNIENSDNSFGSGFNSKNNIIDFEIQDNIELPYNFISFGANYRMVNFNLTSSANSPIHYVDPNKGYGLTGIFLQDKISLLDNKLNFYLGLKAENYSLIDSKYYLSPMAKVSVSPIDELTVWGGFTQSYTTPGYNQTNVELSLFRAPSPEVFYNATLPLVTQQVYAGAYQQAISDGADDATASAMAQAYVESPTGQATIDAGTNSAIVNETATFPGHFNVAGTNGPKTVPTSFQNFEGGVRVHPMKNLQFETNFFYSIMKDGIGNSPSDAGIISSRAYPGENIRVYYYGNYFKGTNMGLETVLKYYATTDLMFELSHSWYKYTLEYQENDDFDIASLTSSEKDLVNEEYPQIPEHVIRGKIYYTLNDDWKFTLSGLYATEYNYKFGTVDPTYSYENQRYDPLYGDSGDLLMVGGKNDNRVVLNLRVDKYLLDDKLNVYVYGSDLTKLNPFVEGANQFETIYPRQVGGMIGAGVAYRIE